jgi:hypothetical protein
VEAELADDGLEVVDQDNIDAVLEDFQ